MVSFRKFYSWLALVGMSVCALSAPVYAQQPAGQAIPDTQNPQSITGQPIQQRGEVQTTEAANLLNQSRTIVIPTGSPAPAARTTESGENSVPAALIVIMGLVGLGLMGVWLKAARSPGETQLEEVAPLETSKPKPQKSKTTKKKPRSKRRH